MGLKERYIARKENLLKDKSICKENRELFREFFLFEENKLKRMNGLAILDDGCFKTLDGYITKLTNVNIWFKNKPWKKLTEKDIRKVYNDLEDGIIKNRFGEKYKDLISYYDKIFCGKPFRMAGKKELAEKVFEFRNRPVADEVRFIWENAVKEIIDNVNQPKHKCLTWLAYDIGENINTLLRLKKKNFTRQINEQTKEPEYIINLPKKELKRTRQTRSEFTLLKETVQFLDIILNQKKEIEKDGKKMFVELADDDLIFDFEYRQAKKFLDRAVEKSQAKCIPNNQPVTWKDLRSSMACRLLRENWTVMEINARLGHTVSSDEINKYVNFLAINRHESKKKSFDSNLRKVADDLEHSKERETLQDSRIKKLVKKSENNDLRWAKLLDFFEKHPQIAKEMKKDPEALKELFSEEETD